MRVDRLAHGNLGTHRDLTHGVSELKVDVGPPSSTLPSRFPLVTAVRGHIDQPLQALRGSFLRFSVVPMLLCEVVY